jgi:hypothetical protein
MPTHAIRPSRVQNLVSSIFDDDLHAKRVASLSNAVVGALLGARLAVATIGRALAVARDRRPRPSSDSTEVLPGSANVWVELGHKLLQAQPRPPRLLTELIPDAPLCTCPRKVKSAFLASSTRVFSGWSVSPSLSMRY